MNKCKNCNSENLVECKLVGYNYVKIKNSKRVKSSHVLCLACSDCGEVNRIYAKNPEKIKNKK